MRLKLNTLDRIILYLSFYCFLNYIFQIQFILNINSFFDSIIGLSVAGFILRINLFLCLLRISYLKLDIPYRDIILILFSFFGLFISIGSLYLFNHSTYELAYSGNSAIYSLKELFRYISLFFCLLVCLNNF